MSAPFRDEWMIVGQRQQDAMTRFDIFDMQQKLIRFHSVSTGPNGIGSYNNI